MGALYLELLAEPWRGLQAAASRLVSMPVLNVGEIPNPRTIPQSIETILDAADTSVRATILQ